MIDYQDLELDHGIFDENGFCYFRGNSGVMVRMSPESCAEVFATVAEAVEMDWEVIDEIYEQIIAGKPE